MFKKILNTLIETPLLTSLFIIDVSVLLLHKPPFVFSLIMLAGLAVICLYYGQKLALFRL